MLVLLIKNINHKKSSSLLGTFKVSSIHGHISNPLSEPFQTQLL